MSTPSEEQPPRKDAAPTGPGTGPVGDEHPGERVSPEPPAPATRYSEPASPDDAQPEYLHRTVAPARSTRWRDWKISFAYGAAVALAARLVFFTVAYMAAWLLNDETGPVTTDAFAVWERWDARHLLDLAENGYDVRETNDAALFPLYPLLVRPLIAAGLSPIISGLLVSTVASVIALAFLHRMAEEEVGIGAGRRAALYLAFFPTAIFLVAPYTESLFLAGAIPAFYFARRQRWLWSGAAAAVATGSRAVGVFLLAGLGAEFLSARSFTWRRTYEAVVGLTLGALPLLAYGAWLNSMAGDPLVFFEAQREGWGRTFSNPYEALIRTWQTWDNPGNPTNWLLVWRIEVIAAGIGAAAVAWALARREWGFAVYMGGGLGALVSSTWFFSIPRMLVTFFPLFLFLAILTRRRPVLHEPLLAAFAAVAALGAIVFTRFMWFF